MKKFLLCGAFLFLAACTNPPKATEAIKNSGLEPLSVGGYSFFGCADSDWYQTKFTAKRADGAIVSGVVCQGLFFKGQTVRFD